MSIHRTLVLRATLKRSRNVLTRAERIEILQAKGKWEEGKSVYCLPKVKGELVLKKKAKVKAKEGEDKTAATTTAAPAAAEKSKEKAK